LPHKSRLSGLMWLLTLVDQFSRNLASRCAALSRGGYGRRLRRGSRGNSQSLAAVPAVPVPGLSGLITAAGTGPQSPPDVRAGVRKLTAACAVVVWRPLGLSCTVMAAVVFLFRRAACDGIPGDRAGSGGRPGRSWPGWAGRPCGAPRLAASGCRLPCSTVDLVVSERSGRDPGFGVVGTSEREDAGASSLLPSFVYRVAGRRSLRSCPGSRGSGVVPSWDDGDFEG
jgi:hypothetical protein